MLVTVVGAIETVGDSIGIQQVSWRRPRATDFRTVQGAVSADGVGNLLSGLAGTVPNTTYSSSIAVAELTGVASRTVGIHIGVLFLVAAFLPKATGAILAIPDPVVAAYVTVIMAMLFVLGMRIAVQDGIDYRKSIVVGVAFWLGVGFQNQQIFADLLGDAAAAVLENGMAAGGLRRDPDDTGDGTGHAPASAGQDHARTRVAAEKSTSSSRDWQATDTGARSQQPGCAPRPRRRC